MARLPRYLLWVLALSVPLWAAAHFLDATKIIPVKLPLSALQFLSVLGAALIAGREHGESVGTFLKRGLDLSRIADRRWRVGVFVMMPVVVFASYELARIGAVSLVKNTTPLYVLPAALLVYGISGYAEQLGWTAVMTDALLERFSVLKAGLIVGVTWSAWHVIPFTQTHNSAAWIAWQCLFTIIYRILLTKVYVATGRSVFSTVAMHATYNTAFTMLPYYGSSYRPMDMAIVTLLMTSAAFAVRMGGDDMPHGG